MSWIFVFLFSSILFNISQTRRPLIQWQLGDPPVDEITCKYVLISVMISAMSKVFQLTMMIQGCA